MADGERTKVRLDAFTAKVVPDPKNPGESLLLVGFLGASSEPKQTRIYWDASLSSFVDVETADIIYSEPLGKEQSPLGGSYIWVKRSAEVTIGSAGGSTAKGKFFQGPVMTVYGGTFGGAAATVGAPMTPACNAPSQAYVCQLTPACPPTPVHPCGGVSHWNVCTVNIVCQHTLLCPINTAAGCWLTPACPVLTPGCPGPPGPGPVEGPAAAAAGGAAPGAQYTRYVCTNMNCPTHIPWCGSLSYECWVTEAAQCNLLPVQGAPAAAVPQAIPSLICSYGPGCWFSWGACPTFVGCGPHPPRPEVAAPEMVGTYRCWISWQVLCHTVWPGCPPTHYVPCPQAPAPPAEQAFAGSYAPHCWFSWNACPTQYGCGPHRTPGCPQAPAHAPYPTMWCHSYMVCPPGSLGSCGHHCTV
jgi:hypothetical protein